MSGDVIIVSKDVGRRAESLIASGGGNVTKGIELLLVENLYVEGGQTIVGANQMDCSAAYKRGLKILQDAPFDVLGVDLGCQTVDVRKAYKKLALKYHPDKNPKTTPLFQVIQSASSKLSVAEDRQKEELQAQAKKKMSNHPTPSSFASKPTPTTSSSAYPSYAGGANMRSDPKPQPSQPSSSYTTPRTGPNGNASAYPGSYGAAPNNGYSYGAQNGASSYHYGGAGGAYPANGQKPTSNAYFNPNNPYAQANAQRQQSQQNQQNQQQPSQQNPYSQYGNYKHDDAKRKNYYEELLKEQYRKAAESDQRAREFAAKRASEQKTEFDSYAKRAQQQYQQYQQQSKANDPPIHPFRPSAAPDNNPNVNFSNFSKQQQQPKQQANKDGGSGIPSSSTAYPYSQGNASGVGGKSSVDPTGMPAGIGKTYKATSDGRVYPQQQYSQPSPRPSDAASNVNTKPAAGSSNTNTEPSKQPSFSNKKVVPRPFAFKTNSVASTVVELEWKTSVLHHCNLGVELSWKEQKSTIWEVSEKMIRSGCCRKKNLVAGGIYEFRVRAVEDLPGNVPGNKSEWSDVIIVTLTPPTDNAAPNKGNNSKPVPPQQSHAQVPPASARSQQHSSESTPRFPDKEKMKDKRPPPPNEIPKPPPQPTTEPEKKFQPSAPTKSDSVPQKFRRFNSKMKEGHQMEVDHDKRHGDYGDIPRPDPPVRPTPVVAPPHSSPDSKNQFSTSKVLSASAREAWGKETQRMAQDQEKDKENNKNKDRESKDRETQNKKKELDNLGEGVHYVEVEGEEEIDEEDEVLMQSKAQSEWSNDEEEIAEDEELRDSQKEMKQAEENSKNLVQEKSPKGERSDIDDSESISSFDKKLEMLDREYEKEKGKVQISKKVGVQHQPNVRAGKKDASPFAIESDDDEEEDNYEDDGFAVEEEIHYQLFPPAIQEGRNKKTTMGKSKKNSMEVMDETGTSHGYLHPVHAEPFVRSEVKGYLIAEKKVIACATCGDWVRVKIHILKDVANASGGKNKQSGPVKQASSVDIWGWCMKKDKDHNFLQNSAGQSEGSNNNSPMGNISRAESQSSVSSLPSIVAPNKSKKSNAASSNHGKDSHQSSEYRTPLKKKTLSSKNSLGNTSLFNLNKPTPKTANKKSQDGQSKRKKQGDIEHFDLEDSYDEEMVPQWMECYDDQGNIYYYNDRTKESSWDAPEWIEEVDPATGAKYYCHFGYNGEEVSMTSTWTRPKQFARVIRHVTDI
jgi:curved DNA-binding protein CbpA